MTSRRRTIIISAVVLAVLGGAVALLAFMPEASVEPEVSPSPAVTEVSLTDEPEEDIASIVFTPKDGEGYTITRKSDGVISMTANGETLFPFIQADVEDTFYAAIGQTAVTPVTENADDSQLENFGLTKPDMALTINRTDGTKLELDIGIESTVSSSRYARFKGERAVYLIKYYPSILLSKSAEDFYRYAFLPDYITPASDENTTYYYLTSITMTNGDNVLQLTRDAVADTDFELVKPYKVSTNSYTLAMEFLIPITNIAPTECIEEHPTDLSKYGLDNPARLELDDMNGWSGTLLTGKTDPATGGRYVMIEGIDAVLLDTTSPYVFLDVTVSRVRSGLAWVFDIPKIASIDFELMGEKRRVEYNHTSDTTLTALYDGKEITELNGRRLYSSLLAIVVDGDTDAEIPSRAANYRFTINFTDGTSSTLELYEINDRQCLFVLDGENMHLFTYKTTLRGKFLDKIALLDNGEDIPFM